MRKGLLVLAWALASCGGEDQMPVTPLDRDRFVQVLTGALLVEARLGHEMTVDHRMDSPMQQYYADLFKEQGVSEADFKRTYALYAEHPEQLKAVYEEVLQELQRRQDAAVKPADSTATAPAVTAQ